MSSNYLLFAWCGFILLTGAGLWVWVRQRERQTGPEGVAHPPARQADRVDRPPPAAPPMPVQVLVDIPSGRRVQVTVKAVPGSKSGRGERPTPEVKPALAAVAASQEAILAPASLPLALPSRPAAAAEKRIFSLETTLFALALAIYLITRLVRLADFPIYFFSDEAVPSMVASDFLRDGYRNYAHELFPTYFLNIDKYSLGVTVYLQILPNLVLGRSIWTVRGLSVLVTLLAVAATGLILRDIFNIPTWWSGTLLLSIAPAWFLHSRTAFETATMASLYAGGLYFYLLYRCRSPRFLYLAILLFALAFYTYSPGQLIIAVTAVLLFFSDLRYHWQNRATTLRGLGLLALLSLPYLRFRLSHPADLGKYLDMLNSYWALPLPLYQKMARYVSNYAYLISPFYWYLPNGHDGVRHLMKGYGHLLWVTLPFAILGLWVATQEFRSPYHRAVLACLLAAPSAAALVEVPSNITRCLVLVIPATLLTGLGIWRAVDWIEKRRMPRLALSIWLFAMLAVFNLAMLGDALANGPTWFRDYGLSGMQYGAQQVFSAIRDDLRQDPQADITLSPNWSYATHEVARFFLKEPVPIRIGSIDNFLNKRQPLGPNSLLILPPPEYEQAVTSDRFTDIQVERVLNYPDGNPGFYFVRMKYVPNIDEILARELEEEIRLQPEEVVIDGQGIQVMYSPLDIGTIADVFDGSSTTLARTRAANPAVIEMVFPQGRTIRGLELLYGTTLVEVAVKLYNTEGDQIPDIFTRVLEGRLAQPQTELSFGRSFIVQKIRLEVRDTTQTQPGHVHLWEIRLW